MVVVVLLLRQVSVVSDVDRMMLEEQQLATAEVVVVLMEAVEMEQRPKMVQQTDVMSGLQHSMVVSAVVTPRRP